MDARERQELDNWITREDTSVEPDEAGEEEARPAAPIQYLAWGGESDGFALVTVEEIAKSIEHAHYSGYEMWMHFARISWTVRRIHPHLDPVKIEEVGGGDGQGGADDYVSHDYRIGVDTITPGKYESFTVTIDGRA